MHLADNKYKVYIQGSAWGQPSKEQAEIVALTTKIDVLQKQLSGAKQSSNQRKTIKKEEAKPKTKGKTDTTKKSGKSPKKKGKGNNKFAWKMVVLTGSEVKIDGFPFKTVDEKVYYWCRNHEEGKDKWVLHHPGQCKNEPGSNSSSASSANVNIAAFEVVNDSDDNE
ncbi:hypothetical protein ACA910_006424 [Epithemia clementina (nom. ined.)]